MMMKRKESEDEPADKDDQSEHEDEHSDEFHGQQIMEESDADTDIDSS